MGCLVEFFIAFDLDFIIFRSPDSADVIDFHF